MSARKGDRVAKWKEKENKEKRMEKENMGYP